MLTNQFGVSQPQQAGRNHSSVSNSRDPNEGPEVFPQIIDFTATPTFTLDMSLALQGGAVSNFQTMYVDNSDNNKPVIVTIQGTNQRIVIGAGRIMYVAVLASQPSVFVFSSVGSNATGVYVALLNVPMPFAEWAPFDTSIYTESTGSIVATTATFKLGAGVYALDYIATVWNSSTLTLQKLAGDGVTYVIVSGSYTANGSDLVALPSGTYKWVISGGPPTALYAEANIVPGGSV